MKFIFFFFFSLFISISLYANPGWDVPDHPAVSWEAPAEWILATSYSDIAPSSAYVACQPLLCENQRNAETDEAFTRVVYRVLDGGVEDFARIEISFDPIYEKVQLHALKLIRNGEILPLPLRQRIHLIQRESDLESHLYSGEQTLVFFVPDVRVGDIIDYSYTITGSNPTLAGHYADDLALDSAIPIEKVSYRLLRDPNRPLLIHTLYSDLIPTEHLLPNGLLETSFTFKPEAAVEDDGNTPSWYFDQPTIIFSEFEDWQTLATWAEKRFEIADSSAIPQDFLLSLEGSTDHERVVNALRFVQDDIRYLGFEEGIHAFQAHDPLETLLRRYGDCKDKVLLLHGILKQWGISSAPALVNQSLCQTVRDLPPSHILFDHAILKVDIGGTSYWVDPTLKYEGGDLTQSSHTEYGSALVVGEGLVNLLSNGKLNSVNEKTTLKLPSTEEAGIVEIKRELIGGAANGLREMLAVEGQSAVADMLHGEIEEKFAIAEPLEKPHFTDDRNENRITITERYRVELADDVELSQFFRATSDSIPVDIDPERSLPLNLGQRYEITETFTIESPGIAERFSPFVNEFDHPAAHFAIERISDGPDHLSTSLYVQSFQDHVSPKNMRTFADFVDEIEEYLFWTIPLVPSPAFQKFDIPEGGAIVYHLLLTVGCIALFAYVLRKTIAARRIWLCAFCCQIALSIISISFFALRGVSIDVFQLSALILFYLILYRKAYRRPGGVFLTLSIAVSILNVMRLIVDIDWDMVSLCVSTITVVVEAFYLVAAIRLKGYNAHIRRARKQMPSKAPQT